MLSETDRPDRVLLVRRGLRLGAPDCLHLEVLDEAGNLLPLRTVDLQATLPARDLGPLDIDLTRDRTGWVGDFDFLLAGTWTLTLAVEDRALAGVVTTGELVIG
jgi:hypothetical protein